MVLGKLPVPGRPTIRIWGWSGGAMVLGKLPVSGRPTVLTTVGPTALAVGAGGSCLDIFKEREKEERIVECKNVQTTPTRTYCKCSRPLPYCNPNCRTPRHWKFTQHHRTTQLTFMNCMSSDGSALIMDPK